MSFGYSAGDFIICIRLAHKVWRGCRDAPEAFRNVFNEVASLQLVLKDMQEAVDTDEPNQIKSNDLAILLKGCNDILQELQRLLEKRDSLGTQSRRTWDRMRWIEPQIKDIRQRLQSSLGLLNAFHISITRCVKSIQL